jgi:hypothetical protein
MTYTPEKLMKLNCKEFIELCKKENVTNLKEFENLLGMAQVEMQTIMNEDLILAQKYIQAVEIIAKDTDFMNLIQNIMGIGVVLGQIRERKEIVKMIFNEKTPECFKQATPKEKLDK